MIKYIPLFAVIILGFSACTTSTTEPLASNEVATPNSVSIGAVEGTPDSAANGIIQVLEFGESTQVKAEINIIAVEDMYYQLWLTDASEQNWVPVGTLRSRTRDARHSTNFETKQDLTDYNQLRVSMQQIGTEATKDTIVANATIINR